VGILPFLSKATMACSFGTNYDIFINDAIFTQKRSPKGKKKHFVKENIEP
jgi:hypothetical protein